MSNEDGMDIPLGMSEFVDELVGSELIQINIKYDAVDFVFDVFPNSYTLKISKEFVYSLSNNQPLKYNPYAEQHDLMLESGKFVFLQGKSCTKVDFSRNGIGLYFDEASNLFVKFEPEDFEPIHFVGASGVNGKTMDFYYVL